MRSPLVRLPPAGRLEPTWRQADPHRIDAALKTAQQRNPGGWHVVAASTDVPSRRTTVRRVAGREVVLWRGSDGGLAAGPGACPHLGASLDGCAVDGSTFRCPWHGLGFSPRGSIDWSPWPAYDDGVLAWVRLPTEGEEPTDRPVVPERPAADRSVAAVVAVRGVCEPRDVIANRLDPWHGSWFHPYAFTRLTVDEAASSDEQLVVDVTYRVGPRHGVPVRAVFACPDARTITMHIVEGEGTGSVVETHATLIGPGPSGDPVTQVTEATIAASDRRGFAVARRLAPALRPAMRHAARRLWVDDLTYAERTYAVRAGRVDVPGS